MKKSDKVRFLLVGVCAVASIAVLYGGISPGRDFGGGVSIVATSDKDNRAGAMEVLRKRITSLQPSDALVAPSGSDQIVVSLSRRDGVMIPAVQRLCREPGLLSLQLVHRKSEEWVKQLWESKSAPDGFGIETSPDGRNFYVRSNDDQSTGQASALASFHSQPKSRFMLASVVVSGKRMFVPYYLEQQPEMSGVDVDRAWTVAGQNSEWTVVLQLGRDGKRTYKEITAEHCPHGHQNNDSDTGRQLAVMMDNRVLSVFMVPGIVDDGNLFVERIVSKSEADHLRNICASGYLRGVVRTESCAVGPDLGDYSILRLLAAVVLASLAILLLAAIVWAGHGVVIGACVAVAALLMPLGMLIAAGILELISGSSGARGFFVLPVVTLPGLAGAGLALAVGMGLLTAIRERVSEELRTGKALAIAVVNGYRKAAGCVIDALGAGLLAGLLLYLAGTGPANGFATAMSAGLIASLFVIMAVSRTAFGLVVTGQPIVVVKTLPEPFARIDFVGKRLYAIVISAAIILLTFGLLIFNSVTGRQVVLFRDMLQAAPAFGFALVGVVAWMTIRFGMRYAAGAVAAAANAILLAVGIFGISGHPVGPAPAAALVIVAGCSIYVALVIFDRVRELGKDVVYKRKPEAEVLNAAIRRTMLQTLMTCGTVLLGGVAITLVCRGAVLDFGLLLIIGAFCAAFSSIFVAVPVALALSKAAASGAKTP